MSPSGPQDPHGAGHGLFGFGAHFDALSPHAPLPRKVAIVRMLMFIGGACGIGLSLLFVMGLSVSPEEMGEVLRQQSELAAEENVELAVTPEVMRSMMGTLAVITGVYGLLSTFLASRIRHRTLGAYWGVVLFQGAAAALLTWNMVTGDILAAVPLGFAVYMIVAMFSREGRAYYGLY
ncbi:hypothetical protein DFP74_1052 [Nocardiopsis sp. Huas11]|uniref:hypothetical protein n=1 Tax=Nocardiopsis sp. Huas11 TaxID=2183912 RepID=UPI000EABD874|nr:hypothetical protein [Nocardiopsis sp. Huas11]RKS05453.1 hypothetical protein DFP74_1052 [Nocardiopsis sp. Huas11]